MPEQQPFIELSQPSASDPPEMPPYGIVVIGGSAGGIPALIDLLSALPTFPIPILVVQHLSPVLPTRLAEVLGMRTRLTVKWAECGEILKAGTVYVAPPDRHLLVMSSSRIALSSAARVGHWRPAVDLLFQSAAAIFAQRTIGIVLSGALWDGTKGISAVRDAGGITITQDEATSDHFDMPAAAIDLGRADVVMTPRKIAAALQVLTESSA